MRNLIDVEEDTPVWRVFDIDYFLSDVQHRKLTLVRVSLWDDPFENFLEKCVFLYAGHRIGTASILRWFFGQCWTLSARETDATWRIYSPKKRGVRVRSTIGRLFSALWQSGDREASLKFFVGRVKYLSEAEIVRAMSSGETATSLLVGGGGTDQVRMLLLKRHEFDHENEVRLIFRDTQHQYDAASIFQAECDPNRVYLDATFDPRMETSEVAAAEVKLRTAGFDGAIRQSELYKLPTATIDLS